MSETSPIPQPVLVTGAGGLIGSAICRELAARRIAMRAFLAPDEPPTNIDGLEGITILRGDIRDVLAVVEASRGAAAVIHCAAINSLWHQPNIDFATVNAEGTDIACRAALAAGVQRFVYTSSCEVLGPAMAGPPADERRPLDGSRVRGHYERSKFLAEEIVRRHIASGLKAVILRPTAVMGPGDIHGTPPGKLVRAYLERRIPAYYDAGINVVDARDVAAAHVEALTRTSGGETYIVGGHNVMLSTLFEELERASGVPAPKRRVGYGTAMAITALKWLASRVTGANPGITVNGLRTVRQPWFFDSSRAEGELALSARPLAETVRDVVRWFVEHQGCRITPAPTETFDIRNTKP